MLPLGPWPSLAVVVVLAILTFVPTRHLYPSQPGRLNRLATLLGVPWTFLFVWLIWKLPQRDRNRRRVASTMHWAWISLVATRSFYLGVSWAISVAHWQKRLKQSLTPASQAGKCLEPRRPAPMRWPSATSTKNKQHPTDHEERDDGQNRVAAGRDGENRRPEDPREFLGDAEETEELARLVAWDQAGEERPAQSLRSPLHRPDQDRQHHEMGRACHEVAEDADRHVGDQPEHRSIAWRRSAGRACRRGTRTECRRTARSRSTRS